MDQSSDSNGWELCSLKESSSEEQIFASENELDFDESSENEIVGRNLINQKNNSRNIKEIQIKEFSENLEKIVENDEEIQINEFSQNEKENFENYQESTMEAFSENLEKISENNEQRLMGEFSENKKEAIKNNKEMQIKEFSENLENISENNEEIRIDEFSEDKQEIYKILSGNNQAIKNNKFLQKDSVDLKIHKKEGSYKEMMKNQKNEAENNDIHEIKETFNKFNTEMDNFENTKEKGDSENTGQIKALHDFSEIHHNNINNFHCYDSKEENCKFKEANECDINNNQDILTNVFTENKKTNEFVAQTEPNLSENEELSFKKHKNDDEFIKYKDIPPKQDHFLKSEDNNTVKYSDIETNADISIMHKKKDFKFQIKEITTENRSKSNNHRNPYTSFSFANSISEDSDPVIIENETISKSLKSNRTLLESIQTEFEYSNDEDVFSYQKIKLETQNGYNGQKSAGLSKMTKNPLNMDDFEVNEITQDYREKFLDRETRLTSKNISNDQIKTSLKKENDVDAKNANNQSFVENNILDNNDYRFYEDLEFKNNFEDVKNTAMLETSSNLEYTEDSNEINNHSSFFESSWDYTSCETAPPISEEFKRDFMERHKSQKQNPCKLNLREVLSYTNNAMEDFESQKSNDRSKNFKLVEKNRIKNTLNFDNKKKKNLSSDQYYNSNKNIYQVFKATNDEIDIISSDREIINDEIDIINSDHEIINHEIDIIGSDCGNKIDSKKHKGVYYEQDSILNRNIAKNMYNLDREIKCTLTDKNTEALQIENTIKNEETSKLYVETSQLVTKTDLEGNESELFSKSFNCQNFTDESNYKNKHITTIQTHQNHISSDDIGEFQSKGMIFSLDRKNDIHNFDKKTSTWDLNENYSSNDQQNELLENNFFDNDMLSEEFLYLEDNQKCIFKNEETFKNVKIHEDAKKQLENLSGVDLVQKHSTEAHTQEIDGEFFEKYDARLDEFINVIDEDVFGKNNVGFLNQTHDLRVENTKDLFCTVGDSFEIFNNEKTISEEEVVFTQKPIYEQNNNFEEAVMNNNGLDFESPLNTINEFFIKSKTYDNSHYGFAKGASTEFFIDENTSENDTKYFGKSLHVKNLNIPIASSDENAVKPKPMLVKSKITSRTGYVSPSSVFKKDKIASLDKFDSFLPGFRNSHEISESELTYADSDKIRQLKIENNKKISGSELTYADSDKINEGCLRSEKDHQIVENKLKTSDSSIIEDNYIKNTNLIDVSNTNIPKIGPSFQRNIEKGIQSILPQKRALKMDHQYAVSKSSSQKLDSVNDTKNQSASIIPTAKNKLVEKQKFSSDMHNKEPNSVSDVLICNNNNFSDLASRKHRKTFIILSNCIITNQALLIRNKNDEVSNKICFYAHPVQTMLKIDLKCTKPTLSDINEETYNKNPDFQNVNMICNNPLLAITKSFKENNYELMFLILNSNYFTGNEKCDTNSSLNYFRYRNLIYNEKSGICVEKIIESLGSFCDLEQKKSYSNDFKRFIRFVCIASYFQTKISKSQCFYFLSIFGLSKEAIFSYILDKNYLKTLDYVIQKLPNFLQMFLGKLSLLSHSIFDECFDYIIKTDPTTLKIIPTGIERMDYVLKNHKIYSKCGNFESLVIYNIEILLIIDKNKANNTFRKYKEFLSKNHSVRYSKIFAKDSKWIQGLKNVMDLGISKMMGLDYEENQKSNKKQDINKANYILFNKQDHSDHEENINSKQENKNIESKLLDANRVSGENQSLKNHPENICVEINENTIQNNSKILYTKDCFNIKTEQKSTKSNKIDLRSKEDEFQKDFRPDFFDQDFNEYNKNDLKNSESFFEGVLSTECRQTGINDFLSKDCISQSDLTTEQSDKNLKETNKNDFLSKDCISQSDLSTEQPDTNLKETNKNDFLSKDCISQSDLSTEQPDTNFKETNKNDFLSKECIFQSDLSTESAFSHENKYMGIFESANEKYDTTFFDFNELDCNPDDFVFEQINQPETDSKQDPKGLNPYFLNDSVHHEESQILHDKIGISELKNNNNEQIVFKNIQTNSGKAPNIISEENANIGESDEKVVKKRPIQESFDQNNFDLLNQSTFYKKNLEFAQLSKYEKFSTNEKFNDITITQNQPKHSSEISEENKNSEDFLSEDSFESKKFKDSEDLGEESYKNKNVFKNDVFHNNKKRFLDFEYNPKIDTNIFNPRKIRELDETNDVDADFTLENNVAEFKKEKNTADSVENTTNSVENEKLISEKTRTVDPEENICDSIKNTTVDSLISSESVQSVVEKEDLTIETTPKKQSDLKSKFSIFGKFISTKKSEENEFTNSKTKNLLTSIKNTNKNISNESLYSTKKFSKSMVDVSLKQEINDSNENIDENNYNKNNFHSSFADMFENDETEEIIDTSASIKSLLKEDIDSQKSTQKEQVKNESDKKKESSIFNLFSFFGKKKKYKVNFDSDASFVYDKDSKKWIKKSTKQTENFEKSFKPQEKKLPSMKLTNKSMFDLSATNKSKNNLAGRYAGMKRNVIQSDLKLDGTSKDTNTSNK